MSRPPLSGLRIIELAGIGPGPFAGMMLADHGAEVIRIERIGSGKAGPEVAPDKDILLRSRKTIELDLKNPASQEVLLDLVRKADGLIEGFRPGVIERLGLGPDVLHAANPRLVIGRMTGWGQTGPMAHMAGHDLNYIAISGALHGVGRKGEKPVVPLNLFGDFGGGGMVLAFGMLAALHHAKATGEGQVVDAAMTDGSALLTAMIQTFRQIGIWQDDRGVNLLDGGAHFYDTYETKDGKYVSIGAIEPQFYARLLDLLGLTDDPAYARQMEAGDWDQMRDGLTRIFRTRTRDEWDDLLMGTDACYAPVLSLTEAPDHPHNTARATFTTAGGIVQPGPAPRYSRSPTVPPEMFQNRLDTDDVLAEIGYDTDRIRRLRDESAIS
ncbi:CaiB/BaiF CoA transferase family protein [Pseudooceanicola nitratireducens]|uniref:CaiB/BaiF CoA transferase family protein n=1 Tax=Pseudooceanicola nitratireducens TaxID=517719 RepID=UPI001C956AEA|nr:CaiB/BaiF CoA-transferase family protein [Pseudooceanicola nitratireducens]MBY6159123.1 CoA transferase [Pseudooceanicola nitratireducens]